MQTKKTFFKRYFLLVISLFAILLTSCTNLLGEKDLEDDISLVSFTIQGYDSSNRTIYPTVPITTDTYYTLLAAKKGEIQTVLKTVDDEPAEYKEWSFFNSAQFRLAHGTWEFTLECYKKVSDESYELLLKSTPDPLEKEITSDPNAIEFVMRPVGTGNGNIEVKLNYKLGADSESTVTAVNAVLTKEDGSEYSSDDWAETDTDVITCSNPVNNNGIITYTKNEVPNGNYILTFKVTTTLNGTSETKDSYRSDEIHVVTGYKTSNDFDIDLDLEQLYSITYEGMKSEEGVSYWKAGYTPPDSYSPYHKTSLPIRENTNRNDAAFMGWYDNPSLTGDPVTETPINVTTPKPLTYYASWRKNERYVSANGTDTTGSGSLESPYKTLEYALSQLADGSLGWTIYIVGEITENVNITTTSSKAKSITIEGQTDSSTNKISGKDNGNSVITVSTTVPVTFRRINITGGKGTIVGTDITGGGGILINTSDSEVTLGIDSVISGNTATRGAGVYVNLGTLNIEGCSINSNTATDGAGVYVTDSGKVVMDRGSIGEAGKENTATGSGGGIWSAGTLEINGSSKICNNTASTGSGGGIYSIGSLTVKGSQILDGEDKIVEISNNSAKIGGGIYSNGTKLSVSLACISENSAIDGNGGGIYASSSTDVEIRDSNIIGNSASVFGGGVYSENSGEITLSNVLVGKDVSSGNTAVKGGGVYNASGTLTVSSGKIAYNTASSDSDAGAGIYNADGASLNLDGADITNNTAENGNAGGIYNAGTFTMTSGNIASNTAVNGAGVYCDSNSTFTMSAGSIGGNTATTAGGGVYNAGSMFIYGTAVVGDDSLDSIATSKDASNPSYSNAAALGGGIYNNGSLWVGYSSNSQSAEYTKGVYRNTSDNGGGIANAAAANLTISNGLIKNNYAASHGGGIHNGGDFTFIGGTINRNKTAKTGSGGGVYNNSSMSMYSNAIIGDSSEHSSNATKSSYGNYSGSGGGIYNEAQCTLNLGISNNNLTGGVYYNFADGDGGGVYNAGTFSITSGYILWNGVAEAEEGEAATKAGIRPGTSGYTNTVTDETGSIQQD